jgi:hypothetical protein
MRACAMIDEARHAAHATKRAHRAVHATGYQVLGCIKQGS